MALNRTQTALGAVLGLSLVCIVAYVTLREQPDTKRIVAPTWARAGFTGSMVPTFRGGERYLIEPAPFQAIRKGDIIVVWWEARSLNVVHRAIDIKRDDKGQTVAIATKGDANQVRDPYLCTESNYVGRAVWPPNGADLSNGVLSPAF
jgi:signal peptidase I